ncbi:MAG: HEPN domain-containing protein [Oligoflexia bacterium]|nr:HEPN domain-containing protein [Oligoflexia bacterium]MBF0365681.1 HEPN domain-containing protein [Oligoflexia bacterium]
MTSRGRAKDWWAQAENDLLWAKDSLSHGHFAQTCFIAQQVAEKALKSLALHQGYEKVKSHAISTITKELKINGELEIMGKKLDLYYISSRSPDAFTEGAPFEFFTEDQAREAISFADKFLEKIRALFKQEKEQE